MIRPPRLIRTPHHIPRLILQRAEVWATERNGEDGEVVLRDGRGHRFVCGISRGVQQVSDTYAQTLASRYVWARSVSALMVEGEVLRGGGVSWSRWRTYDHPSGKRRTLESRP